MKKTIISLIFGTRPEAIKLAPVILAMQKSRKFSCRVCVTAQHREMLDQALKVFGIVPDIDFDLMQKGQGLAEFTSRCLVALDKYLERTRPQLVMVQGDTTTALCGAMAAFYRGIPVAHVEAGLRTWNMKAPWPEEMNRVMISKLAAVHFAPTELNRQNLLKEGIPDAAIHITGNTVIDALHLALKKVMTNPPDVPGLPAGILTGADKRRMVLITGHRRESFGKGFKNICRAIAKLAGRFPDVHFVYPVHLNPNVRKPVVKILGSKKYPNVYLIEPVPYLAFIALMNRSHIILTDSGGVQEEAPSLGKPVLVMRETTERTEALETGTIQLVGADMCRIYSATARLLRVRGAYRVRAHRNNPYGNGRAAQKILCIMNHQRA